MIYLFVHQNFPGQYLHVVKHLARDPGNRVVFITQNTRNSVAGVELVTYEPYRAANPRTHHYLHDAEAGVVVGQAVYETCLRLKRDGLVPDLMIGHNGWGETLYLKDVWPGAPLLGYFEFYYHLSGADVGFDPHHPTSADDPPRLRTKNALTVLAATGTDWGQTPTRWQWSLHPPFLRDRISVIHEGIDTATVRPNPEARIAFDGVGLTPADEVITYVARNLEPYRGFHVFMRVLPEILRRRPRARVLIAGGDETSYGPRPPEGGSYRQRLLDELGDSLDRERVHFLGKLPYPAFLTILQLSTVHIYLTYPFVLSWSMLESMAAGCVLVASSTPPVTEVIEDGVNGRLVDFFDGTGLVDRVVDALEHRQALLPLRAAARQTVLDRYDLHTCILPSYLELLERLRTGKSVRSG